MTASHPSKSTPVPPSSPRLQILWSGEPGELPAGFEAAGYAPSGPAEELGRGGTYRMPWPDGRIVYYRKFRHGGLLGGVLGHRYWSPARLRSELADSKRLAELGIPVPRPVLGRLERVSFCYRMAIVTEGIEGQTFFEYLQKGQVDMDLLCRVGQTLSALHATGFRHRDLHPANLMVDTAGEIHVLDLEGGSWGGTQSDAHAVASLVRLARYWEKHGPEHALPQLAWSLALLRGYEPDPRKRARLFHRCQERYRSRVFWHRLFWNSKPRTSATAD